MDSWVAFLLHRCLNVGALLEWDFSRTSTSSRLGSTTLKRYQRSSYVRAARDGSDGHQRDMAVEDDSDSPDMTCLSSRPPSSLESRRDEFTHSAVYNVADVESSEGIEHEIRGTGIEKFEKDASLIYVIKESSPNEGKILAGPTQGHDLSSSLGTQKNNGSPESGFQGPVLHHSTAIVPGDHSPATSMSVDGESSLYSIEDDPFDIEETPDPVEERYIQILVAMLIEGFTNWKAFVSRGGSRTNHGSSRGNSNRKTTSGPRKSKTGPSQNRSRSKRGSQESRDDGEDDDKAPNRPGNSSGCKPNDVPIGAKVFVCHWLKKDPGFFQHRHCGIEFSVEFRRFNIHFNRRHRVPLHCARCGQRHKDETEKDEHATRSLPCAPNRENVWRTRYGSVSERKRDEIGEAVRALGPRAKDEDKWKTTWEVLFPGEEAPSPYLEGPVSVEISDMIQYWNSEFANSVVEDFLDLHRNESSDFAEPFAQRLIQRAFPLLLEIAGSRHAEGDFSARSTHRERSPSPPLGAIDQGGMSASDHMRRHTNDSGVEMPNVSHHAQSQQTFDPTTYGNTTYPEPMPRGHAGHMDSSSTAYGDEAYGYFGSATQQPQEMAMVDPMDATVPRGAVEPVGQHFYNPQGFASYDNTLPHGPGGYLPDSFGYGQMQDHPHSQESSPPGNFETTISTLLGHQRSQQHSTAQWHVPTSTRSFQHGSYNAETGQ